MPDSLGSDQGLACEIEVACLGFLSARASSSLHRILSRTVVLQPVSVCLSRCPPVLEPNSQSYSRQVPDMSCQRCDSPISTRQPAAKQASVGIGEAHLLTARRTTETAVQYMWIGAGGARRGQIRGVPEGKGRKALTAWAFYVPVALPNGRSTCVGPSWRDGKRSSFRGTGTVTMGSRKLGSVSVSLALSCQYATRPKNARVVHMAVLSFLAPFRVEIDHRG